MARTERKEIITTYRIDATQAVKALAGIDKSSAKTARNTQKLADGMDSATRQLKKIGGAAKLAFAGFATTGLKRLVTDTLSWADALQNTSNRVGMTTETIQALRAESDKFGLSSQAVDTALQRFARRTEEARQGTGVLLKSFERYGIELNNVDGSQKSVNQLFEEFTGVLQRIEDPAERVKASFSAFDSEGVKLGDTLYSVDGTVQGLTERLKDQNRVVNGESIQAAADLAAKWTETTQQMTTMFQSFVVNVVNGWTEIIQGFNKADIVGSVADTLDINAKIVNEKQKLLQIEEQIALNRESYFRFGPHEKELLGLQTDRFKQEAKINELLAQRGALQKEAVKQRSASLQVVKQEASAQKTLTDETRAGAKATRASADATRDLSAATSDLTFTSQKALRGWEKTNADLRGEIRALVKAFERDTGATMVITSTYRGGKKGSQHYYGNAVDLVASDWAAVEKWWKANKNKFQLEFPVKGEMPGDVRKMPYNTGLHLHAQLAKAIKKTTAATKEWSEGEREAARIIEQNRTPIEKHVDEVEKLQKLYHDGHFSPEEYARAVASVGEAAELAGDRTRDAAEEVSEFGKFAEEAGRQIESGLGDALYNAISGGAKSAMDSLKDFGNAMLKYIADLAARILTQKIIIPIVGAAAGSLGLSGVANAVTGGGVGGLGGATGGVGTLSSITNFFTGNSFSASLGKGIATGINKFLPDLMGPSIAKGIGNLTGVSNLALGGASIGGALLGNALFKGEGYSSIGSSIGSTAGAVIGSMILPGIGTAIGGALGGVGGGFLGKVFGGKKEKPAYVRIVGAGGQLRVSESRGALPKDLQDAISQTNQALQQMLGILSPEAQAAANQRNSAAWGGSARYAPDAGQALYYETLGILEAAASAGDEVAAAARDAFQSSGGDLQLAAQAMQELAQVVALEPQLRDALNQMGIAFNGTRADLFAFVDSLGGVDVALAALSEFSSVSTRAGGQLISVKRQLDQVFAPLGYETPQTLEWFKQIVAAYYDTGQIGAATAVQLSSLSQEFAEFLSAVQSLQQGYYAAFYSPAEQLQESMALINQEFRELGTYVPTSAAGFRELVEALNLNDDVHRELYYNLLAIAPEMKAFYEQVDETGQVLVHAAGGAAALVDAIAGLPPTAERVSAALAKLNESFGGSGPSGAAARDLYVATMREWNVQIAATPEVLHQLIQAGHFTDEMLIVLADHLDIVTDALNEAGQIMSWVDSLQAAPGGAESYALLIEAMREWGLDVVPQTADALYRLIEAGHFTEEQVIALYDGQKELAAAFAYAEQNIDGVGNSLSNLESIISSIERAVGTFSEVQQDVINLDYERAKRELEQLARQDNLPSAKVLDDVLERLTAGASSRTFTSAREEGLANARVRANLELIGDKAKDQLSGVELQTEVLENWRDQQLTTLENIETALVSPEDLPAVSTGGAPVIVGPDGVGSLSDLINEQKAANKRADERWAVIEQWSVQMYASLRAQEIRSSKWDKDGLPPPRDLDRNEINIIAMQGK